MTVPNRLGRWVRICAKCGLAQEPYRLKEEVGRTSHVLSTLSLLVAAVLRFALES